MLLVHIISLEKDKKKKERIQATYLDKKHTNKQILTFVNTRDQRRTFRKNEINITINRQNH